MDINRKQILDTLIRIIHHISNKEYQKRVWIKGVGPEVDDFDETVCHFFQEGDGILDKYQEFGLTDKQYQLLKNFRDNFEDFSDDNSWPPEFIDSPEWTKITDQAKEVLQAFDYNKPIYIKLNEIDFNYLKSTSFLSEPLFLSDYTGEYVLVTDAEEVEKIQGLCKKQLQLINYDEANNLTQEGQILTSIIETLDRKEPPNFESD